MTRGSRQPVGRRVAVIDGCNVISKVINAAYSVHGRNGKFSAAPFLVLVHELLKNEFEVFVTLKEFHNDVKNTDYLFVLRKLEEMQILYFLPDETDDDSVCLGTAKKYGGFVISNDHFRQYDQFAAERERRISIRYDPKVASRRMLESRDGLYELGIRFILGESEEDFLSKAYVYPGDPDEDLVRNMNATVAPDFFSRCMQKCDMMATYIQRELCFTYAYKPPHIECLSSLKELPKWPEFERRWYSRKIRKEGRREYQETNPWSLKYKS